MCTFSSKSTSVQLLSTLPQVDQVEYMLGVWSRLAEAAQQGARAVVLLLEPHHAALFLRAAAGLLEEGLLRPGDFVFLMEDSPLPYIKHECVAPASGEGGGGYIVVREVYHTHTHSMYK